MAACAALLHIEPETTLYFVKTSETSSPHKTLTLANVSAFPVSFRVRTTRPKAYVVPGHTQTLLPNESTEVKIAVKDVLAELGRFVIQAVSGDAALVDWAQLSSDQIEEHKLSVVLEEEDEVERKFDKLMKYTRMLEKENEELQCENRRLLVNLGQSSIAQTQDQLHARTAPLPLREPRALGEQEELRCETQRLSLNLGLSSVGEIGDDNLPCGGDGRLSARSAALSSCSSRSALAAADTGSGDSKLHVASAARWRRRTFGDAERANKEDITTSAAPRRSFGGA